jgi:hypothetical protein
MSQDPLTPTNLTPKVIHFNNVLTDINFIEFIVGLKVYIIRIICVKFQTI